MMPLSYSQNMEDYHLALAFAGQERGTYIDIGAGHPIADNVSFWFYERGWRGIVVEPQASLIDLYARLRPRDVAVCALIGRQCGSTEFYAFDKVHGLSTTVAQYAQAAVALGERWRSRQLPMLTLAQLCDDHGVTSVDFLKVDVEGGERDVLLGGDWSRHRPKVIVLEAVAPLSNEPVWHEWEPFLLSQGYRFALFDTLNRFYVAEEEPEIAARLPSARAPWEAVTHMYEIGRAPENPKHPDHLLARALTYGFWSFLPYLDPDLVGRLLERGRGAAGDGAFPPIDSEELRARLGRIACGYDGGQIREDGAGER